MLREPVNSERLQVLVVDDDDQLLRTLADILRRRGYEPSTAASAHAGLALARAPNEPAIALVDLGLPDMDGLELVHQLRQLSEWTEVVILTGNASLDSALGALHEHTYAYLTKPVPTDQLLSTLDRAGERWRRRRAEESLRQSERRFRLLVENISDMILVLDGDGAIEYASPAVSVALGYSAEDAIGLLPRSHVHPDDRALAEQLLAKPTTDAVEIRLRRRDGDWRLFSCRTADLFGEPEVGGLALIAGDITERRRLETQAIQTQKLDSIGRLAGGVAHDFNNLLSVVLGYSELALSSLAPSPPLRGLLEEIHQAGERGAALTRQLLSFARRHPQEPRLLDLNVLVQEIENLLRRMLGEDIDLVLSLADDPCLVRADPTQIEQVLMNLVVNAREAMPEGGSLVMTTFRAERLPEGAGSDGSDHGLGAGYAVLRVEDSGMGMSADVRSRLFEPFFTTKKSGTGLGLATAYGIVKEAGGHLAVESEASHGATFTVYLPFCEDLPSTEHKAVPLTTLPRGSETILVVEDEPTIRELILRILEPLGYRVLAAANGDEALELTRSGHHAPDLLLSDLIMPGMSGEQLAAVLERENPRLEVLLMSGYNPRGEGGAPTHRLLHKPISPGSLARAVREALDAAS